MSGSDLDVDAMKRVFAPMMLLSGAPEMTTELWAALLGLLASENVTRLELAQAVFDVLKREKFWPAPAVLIERVLENRRVKLLERRQKERKSNLRLVGEPTMTSEERLALLADVGIVPRPAKARSKW